MCGTRGARARCRTSPQPHGHGGCAACGLHRRHAGLCPAASTCTSVEGQRHFSGHVLATIGRQARAGTNLRPLPGSGRQTRERTSCRPGSKTTGQKTRRATRHVPCATRHTQPQQAATRLGGTKGVGVETDTAYTAGCQAPRAMAIVTAMLRAELEQPERGLSSRLEQTTNRNQRPCVASPQAAARQGASF